MPLPKPFFIFKSVLESLKIPYALIGGLAVGLWSEQRFTKDIDFTVALDQKSWGLLKNELDTKSEFKIKTMATDIGYDLPYLVRIEFMNTIVDLLVSLTDFQASLLIRSSELEEGGNKFKVASPEDIIISKLIANRGQDLVDADKIFKMVADLDMDYINHWAKIWQVEDRLDKVLKEIN